LVLVVGAAAASLGGAGPGGGIGLSACPLRLTLRGASSAAVVVRNPGRRTVLVDVSRAGFTRSLRGRPQVRPARDAATWLRLRPRRFRLAPRAKKTLHVVAAPARRAPPGDHPALALLTTRPLGLKHVRVRMRIGVMIVLHVRGRIVRRLDARALSVRRRGTLRLLELRLVNRGNVTERLAADRLRLWLVRRRRKVATLRPIPRELLPHSTGIALFPYRGRLRGTVRVRVTLSPSVLGRRRRFHARL
jgi:hypothetical protein